MKLLKWLFGKEEKEIISKSIDGIRLSNRSGGDYNPFTENEFISSYPLSIEEMEENGFKTMEYVGDRETGYYAWVCKK